MRLRKNMKRTAAAVLALSMAVSAVAAPASAAYICNVSQGSVEVSVNEKGEKTIKVGDDSVTIKMDGTKETTGNGIKEDGDGTEDIVITGDNTKPTESLNAEEENTSEVEKSGENTSEVEKSGETEGEGKTQNSAAEGEDKGDEPTSQELLAPEDEEKKDEQKPADSQEPEQTEKTSDQVIEYGQYDPEAQKEAAKPAAEQKAEEKKAAEEKTYGDTNAPTSLSESVQTAANNVVKIINKSKETLKVILRDLKVDAGNTNKSAVTVSGTGNVTLELDGKNELTGGSGYTGGRKAAGVVVASDDAKLTIQGKEGSSLSATGGAGTGESDNYDGYGIRAGKLDLMDATVTATGGVETEKDSNIKNSKLIANGGIGTNGKFTVGEGGEVIAIGKDVKTTDGKAQGGNALGFWGIGSGYEVQKGGKLTAIGGNAESESGDATGGNALWGEYGGIVSAGETTLIGGNAKSGSGKATGGDAIKGSCDYFTQVTVKEGTFTAAGGKSESATSTAANGNSVNITPVIGNDSKTQLEVQEGGTFVTAKPGNSDENGNGITGKIEINTAGGKIEEMENAQVVKKDDGTVEVVGDLVGIKQDGHSYELTVMEPTCTTPGKRIYTCTTPGHEGETYEEIISDALGHHFVEGVCTRCGAPEQAAAENSSSSAVTLTVTGAGDYETSIADGRYIIAVPAETAVLSGCLGNLRELKAQGVTTIVFRTQLRETALNIDSMLSLGVDDTLFTLTHSGESAELTVGGFAHNELLH
ncbi:MAG: hypothetical protein KH074_10095 [Faecalibacterium prausnitzii]|nr:hypothetical protein [Faecalibacterium prausnitzii]